VVFKRSKSLSAGEIEEESGVLLKEAVEMNSPGDSSDSWLCRSSEWAATREVNSFVVEDFVIVVPTTGVAD
jgi:hypothetical protein